MIIASDVQAGATRNNRLRNGLIFMLFGATLALLAIEVNDLVLMSAQPVHVIEVEDGFRVVVGLPPHHVAPSPSATTVPTPA